MTNHSWCISDDVKDELYWNAMKLNQRRFEFPDSLKFEMNSAGYLIVLVDGVPVELQMDTAA